MANTIDNFTLKVNVEGTAQVKTATADIQNLDKATTTAGKNMGAAAQNIRNVGFQVQDFTVQVANGTSAITALSQQLPQLLSNFGTLGIYLGVVAAALPIAVAAFKLLGGETKDLSERLKDAGDSIDRFQTSSRANIQSARNLNLEFSGLGDAAKRFYEVREQFDRVKAFNDLSQAIIKAKIEFGFFNDEVIRRAQTDQNANVAAIFGPMANVEAIRLIEAQMLAFKTGLPLEQVKELGNRLRDLDANAPEKNLDIITDIAYWLKDSVKDSESLGKIYKELLLPLFQINQQILEFNRNVKEAGDRLVKSSLDAADLQQKFLPQIGEAKRRFDQVAAARLESELKVQGEILKLRERTDLTDSQKALLLLALRKQSSIEVGQAEKDIAKQQFENFRGAYLSADAKGRQVELEGQILDIQEKGRYNLQYETQLEIDRLRNLRDYESTMLNITEMRRKNTITEAQAASLQREAELTQRRANENAEANRQRRINDSRDAQIAAKFDLDTKSISIDSERELLRIRQDMRNAFPDQIDLAIKIAQLTQQQSDYERRILEDVRLGKITREDGNERIAMANANLEKTILLQRGLNEEAARFRLGTAEQGIEDTLARIARDVPSEYQKAGQKVQAVFDGLGNALDTFVRTGKLNFGDLTRSIISDILRIEMRASFSSLFGTGGGLFKSLFGMGGVTSNMAGAAVLGLPGYARGGYLPSGQMGIVGESGPEFITGPANITPMERIAPSTNITYNIQAVDASSFRALVARDPQFIYQVTEAGRRSQPSRRLA